FPTQERAAWSPFVRVGTSLPTSSTMPAPSWPSTAGGGTGSFICCTERSEWHTPLAATLTTTSSARGGLSSSASTLRASWRLKSTAPRTMVRLPAFDRAHRYRPGPKEGSSDAGDRRLQRGPIPSGAVRPRLVRALQEGEQRRVGAGARSHRLVGQHELPERLVEARPGWRHADIAVARRLRVGIGVEDRVGGRRVTRPESGAAH